MIHKCKVKFLKPALFYPASVDLRSESFLWAPCSPRPPTARLQTAPRPIRWWFGILRPEPLWATGKWMNVSPRKQLITRAHIVVWAIVIYTHVIHLTSINKKYKTDSNNSGLQPTWCHRQGYGGHGSHGQRHSEGRFYYSALSHQSHEYRTRSYSTAGDSDALCLPPCDAETDTWHDTQ